MFLQYKPRESSIPNDRPQLVRSNESRIFKCHPIQEQRASLGDTKGAVFLPFTDRPAQSTTRVPASRCFLRPGLLRTASEDHRLPTLTERLDDSSKPTVPEYAQRPSFDRDLYPQRPRRMAQSSSEPALNTVSLPSVRTGSSGPAWTTTLASPVSS